MAPIPRPSSGELWGMHLMPPTITVDCLLPTGVIVPMLCPRESTLEAIKSQLWKEAKTYPLFDQLHDELSYIFVSITQDAKREEFYDENLRLCDLSLFQPILKLVEPAGNKEEKILNYEISKVIGMSVAEFNNLKDSEIAHFRRSILQICRDAVDEREKGGPLHNALYHYPPIVHSDPDLPNHLLNNLDKDRVNVLIWVIASSGIRQKYSVKVLYSACPETLIAEAIRKKVRHMQLSVEQQQQCVLEHQNSYVLKVCGCDEYLFKSYPISQYKYVRSCLAKGTLPNLTLMNKEAVFKSLPRNYFITPTFLRRSSSSYSASHSQRTESLWNLTDNFSVKLLCATYVNVTDHNQIYVRTGLYHGNELLCEFVDSRWVPRLTLCWNEEMTYDLQICDIPRSAKLCLSICAVNRRKNKKDDHCMLAWGNINLLDYKNRIQNGKMSLYMWPVPKGLDDFLNPFGCVGSNPNCESPCLELEFPTHRFPVEFPDFAEIQHYAQWIGGLNMERLSRGSVFSTNSESSDPETEREELMQIIKRDAFSELSEQDKDLLWRMRDECMLIPESLPMLLQAVKWNSREFTSQMYVMLSEWSVVPVEVAMQLLHCNFADMGVRDFAVRCLSEGLTDDQLSLYLLQLVQVLKFEPYFDNPLARFLLGKALSNQRIGHFFFWHLRSEIHSPAVKMRFGLSLESYCRGCGAYLKSLIHQVEALEKLTLITQALKEDQNKGTQKYRNDVFSEQNDRKALEKFISPLNPSHNLGRLLIDNCKILSSAKRPLKLCWENLDSMADQFSENYQIIFKNGDDLRQDMLSLQMIRIMDEIWQREGLDLRMLPYNCLSMGTMVGMIEVVPNAKTVMAIQRRGGITSTLQLRSDVLHQWIKEKKQGHQYDSAIEAFTLSCAGYSVATFILGIGDRHNDNIMMNTDGQIFHIDFGHFLGHFKKKYGLKRERVPFVLTEDFLRVIVKGADYSKSKEFIKFQELCGKAYLALRRHANLFVSLFSMMLSSGIPDLQSVDDLGYLRKTLAVDMTEEESLEYFQKQLNEAYGGGWTTKMDWLCHAVKHM